jgi:hypothetical protein
MGKSLYMGPQKCKSGKMRKIQTFGTFAELRRLDRDRKVFLSLTEFFSVGITMRFNMRLLEASQFLSSSL